MTRRPRPLSGLIVAGAVLIAALVTAVVYFPLRIAREAAARAVEIPGEVTVGFCTYRGRGSDTAECHGSFRSDDGALVVPDVTITFIGANQNMIRRTTERATLAGPDDDTADTPHYVWVEQAVMWTIEALLLAWLVAQSVWFVRECGRHRVALLGRERRPPPARAPA